MGPWKKFESTVVRLKRSYEDTGSVVCLSALGSAYINDYEKYTKETFYLLNSLVISNSMGPWKKFESTVVRLKRSYEETGRKIIDS
jgi:hypothetical protein